MKQLKFALFTVITLMLSVIAFYTFNLVFSFVSNYQAISVTSLAMLPMLFIFGNLVTAYIAVYRWQVRKISDPYFFRFYGIFCSVLSVLGIVSAILNGTIVYHSFVKDYIFKCYPLFTLLISIFMLGISVAILFVSQRKIVTEKIEKKTKFNLFYGIRSFGLGELTVFALERLGAFMLVPVYWSSYDSIYTLPYLIQLLIPSLILITYIIHEDFLHSRKVTLSLSAAGFGYSVISLIYVIAMGWNTYPLMINGLSAVQQFERLVTFPLDLILLYGLSLLLTFLNGLNNAIMLIKEKKTIAKKD